MGATPSHQHQRRSEKETAANELTAAALAQLKRDIEGYDYPVSGVAWATEAQQRWSEGSSQMRRHQSAAAAASTMPSKTTDNVGRARHVQHSKRSQSEGPTAREADQRAPTCVVIHSKHVEAIRRYRKAQLPETQATPLVKARVDGQARASNPPGNTTVIKLSNCSCGQALEWGTRSARKPFATCDSCQLTHYMRVRFIDTAVLSAAERAGTVEMPTGQRASGKAVAEKPVRPGTGTGHESADTVCTDKRLSAAGAGKRDCDAEHTSGNVTVERASVSVTAHREAMTSEGRTARVRSLTGGRTAGGDTSPSTPKTQCISEHVTINDEPVVQLRVGDYRWAAVWEDRASGTVQFWSESQLVSVQPARLAKFWRAAYLQSQPELSAKWRINEMDVTAFLHALIRVHGGLPAAAVSAKFRGEHHVFAELGTPYEPGYTRPASLPRRTGVPHWADDATSAYTPVQQWKSPLNGEYVADGLMDHPYGVYLRNGIKYGFSTQSEPPSEFRGCRPADGADARLQQLVTEEINDNAFIDVTDWPMEVPLRLHPWFGVESSGKYRGICDMSQGKLSHNECTRRAPLMPARLADWTTVAKRIVWMREQRPGVPVLLAKLDAKRAYRQVPIPVRDMRKAVHQVGSKRYANVRLMIGGRNSSDAMSPGITVIADKAAALHAWFAASYIDDKLIVAYEDVMPAALEWFKAEWAAMGWTVNQKKLDEAGPPTTAITFLGVQLDAEQCTASITEDRKTKMLAELAEWRAGRVAATARRFKQLAGTLQFVSLIIPCSRAYMKSIYNAQLTGQLSDAVIDEIDWWSNALATLNGCAVFNPRELALSQHYVSTDACKIGWGWFAPFNNMCGWGELTPDEREQSSTAHWEAAGILFACWALAVTVSGGVLNVYTDSDACHYAFSRQTCDDAKLLAIVRMCVDLQLTYHFQIIVRHLAGSANVCSDGFSRGRVTHTPTGWTRMQPTEAQREAVGGVMRLQKRYARSWDQLRSTLRSGTSLNIASSISTSHQRTQPWTVWNHHQSALPSTDVWSTWPSGFEVASL